MELAPEFALGWFLRSLGGVIGRYFSPDRRLFDDGDDDDRWGNFLGNFHESLIKLARHVHVAAGLRGINDCEKGDEREQKKLKELRRFHSVGSMRNWMLEDNASG